MEPIPPIPQFVADAIQTDTLKRVYKVMIANFMKAILYVLAHKKYAPNIHVVLIEAFIFAAFYFIISIDLEGATHLILVQCLCTFMIYQVKYVLGTVFIMGLLMTWYPAYYEYIDTKLIAFAAEMALFGGFVYKAPNFAYVAFYLCNMAFNFVFTDYPRNIDDMALLGIFATSIVTIYDANYNLENLLSIAFIMGIWMYCKATNFPRRQTQMRPAMEMFMP